MLWGLKFRDQSVLFYGAVTFHAKLNQLWPIHHAVEAPHTRNITIIDTLGPTVLSFVERLSLIRNVFYWRSPLEEEKSNNYLVTLNLNNIGLEVHNCTHYIALCRALMDVQLLIDTSCTASLI